MSTDRELILFHRLSDLFRDKDKWRCVNSSSPPTPSSTPMPDCFAPPQGDQREADIHVGVHPDEAGLDLHRQLPRALRILGPDGPAKAVLGIVGATHRVVDVGVPHHRHDRPELLLVHQPSPVGDVAHDGRSNEYPAPACAARRRRCFLPACRLSMRPSTCSNWALFCIGPIWVPGARPSPTTALSSSGFELSAHRLVLRSCT